MITYWKYDKIYSQVQEWEPGCWIRVDSPTSDELDLLESRWGAPLDFIHDAEDADERPRFDQEEQWSAGIVRVPSSSVDDDGDTVFHTRPLAIMVHAHGDYHHPDGAHRHCRVLWHERA